MWPFMTMIPKGPKCHEHPSAMNTVHRYQKHVGCWDTETLYVLFPLSWQSNHIQSCIIHILGQSRSIYVFGETCCDIHILGAKESKWNIVDWEGWIGTACVDPLAGMNMGHPSQVEHQNISKHMTFAWNCVNACQHDKHGVKLRKHGFVECSNKQHSIYGLWVFALESVNSTCLDVLGLIGRVWPPN